MRWMTSAIAVAGLAVSLGSSSPATAGPKLPSKRSGVAVQPFQPPVAVTSAHVVPENLAAASTLYRAAVLERMRLFAVVDRLGELFASGKLPVGKRTAKRLYRYLEGKSSHLDEASRRRMYGHVLGAKDGGSAGNRDFDGLWLRFLDAAAEYKRQPSIPNVGKTATKATKRASATTVHRRARDLALNLSNRSYGAPVEAAPVLARKIDLAQAIVRDRAIQKRFKADSAWTLVRAVAAKELGVDVDAAKLRQEAERGASVIAWLGKVSSPLSSTGGAERVASDLVETRVPESARGLRRNLRSDAKPTAHSSDYGKVFVLCFDAKKKLVPCVAKDED